MNRVLIVKMSSMGDVIHTLPALTDAHGAYPHIEFDWVVEPHFAQIPSWHPAVKNIIHAPIRRWRKDPWKTYKEGEWHAFLKQLRYTSYDAVIDAQGLVKSALVAKMARGKTYGLHYRSARGRWVSFFYHRVFEVDKSLHAVQKLRYLFANILQYSLPEGPPHYGINKGLLDPISYGENTLIFLHGTTWKTKHWPEIFWQKLAYLVSKTGYKVLIPFGNDVEFARAQRIEAYCQDKDLTALPQVLPKLSISLLTALISKAKAVISVDTGLGHLAAAMGVPTISLYGPTDPGLTGAVGSNQYHLKVKASCSPCLSRTCKLYPKQGIEDKFSLYPPCFESLSPERIYDQLMQIISLHSYVGAKSSVL